MSTFLSLRYFSGEKVRLLMRNLTPAMYVCEVARQTEHVCMVARWTEHVCEVARRTEHVCEVAKG